MRFKTSFLLGCAAGAWAATKAAQARRGDNAQAGWPRVASSRAEHVNAEVNAERVRALSDLARQRLNGIWDSPLGGIARDRLVGIVSTSRGNSRDPGEQHRRPA